MTTEQKRQLIQSDDSTIPLLRKCELLGLSRSTYYYRKVPVDAETEKLMKLLDQHYTEHPYEGKIKRARWLSSQVGYTIGKKRVATLMKEMGLETVYPKPNTSAKSRQEHKIYPYLLNDICVYYPNQVWCSDITYISMKHGQND